MEKPLVSIGIPAYNRPDTLKKTLQCIKDQTYPNLEIIVSDDCSPDDRVVQVVNGAMFSEQRIKFFRQPQNLGATLNCEFILAKATGKYFLWTDDEDLIAPEFVEKLVACMELQRDLVACACDVNTIDHDDNFVAVHQLNSLRPTANWDQARKLFFRYPTSNIFFCILGMYRTDVLKKTNIRNLQGWNGYETNGEVPFLAQLATLGRIAAIPEALKTYRLNPNSIYHSEISTISRFDMFMLRLIIRLRLYRIAVTSELPFFVRLSLASTILRTHLEAILAVLKGAIAARLGRIKRALKGTRYAR